MIRLPVPGQSYDKRVEDERNRQIESAFRDTYSRGVDVEISGSGIRLPRLILVSPDGKRWSVTVNNSGVLSSTQL